MKILKIKLCEEQRYFSELKDQFTKTKNEIKIEQFCMAVCLS